MTSVLMFCFMIILYVTTNNLDKHLTEESKDTKLDNDSYSETVVNKSMIVIAYSIVRDGPNESYSKIGSYNKGDKVQVLSKLSNDWYKINTSNQVGYIKADNVKDVSEAFVDKDGTVIYAVEKDGTIECDGEISNSLLNYAYNYLYMVPENIRNDFNRQGWKIVITDKSLSDELDIGYEISGATIPKDKTIMIYGSQSCIRYALVHEIGHYIDYRSNFISKTADFKNLYLQHGNEMLDYNSNYIQAAFSEEEYFAELYRAAIIGDYKLRFMFSDDIKFVINIANNVGMVNNNNAA